MKRILRSLRDFAALVVGLVSGVAGLIGPSTGTSRVALIVIGAALLLYIVIRVWSEYFVSRNRDLRNEVDRLNHIVVIQQEGHQRFVDAIQRIIDREAVLFEETLEVTIIIGESDEQDVIVERRHTRPVPRVAHRSMRPILPIENGPVLRLEDISYSVSLPENHRQVEQFQLVEDGRLRAWLVFDPPLDTPVEWEVQYRPTGIWNPLRQKGRDKLRWRDQLPTADSKPSALTEFVVKFVFPPGCRPQVEELRQFGELEDATRLPSDQWLIVWRDRDPAGRFYEWTLSRATNSS